MQYLQKFEFLISQGIVATCLRWGGRCHMGFVANFIRFPAVQKFWESVKIWQSYREFKGGNYFLRHSVYKTETDKPKKNQLLSMMSLHAQSQSQNTFSEKTIYIHISAASETTVD